MVNGDRRSLFGFMLLLFVNGWAVGVVLLRVLGDRFSVFGDRWSVIGGR